MNKPSEKAGWLVDELIRRKDIEEACSKDGYENRVAAAKGVQQARESVLTHIATLEAEVARLRADAKLNCPGKQDGV